ncbi:Pycsar system effector family protein [Streptomyces hawaiiensis]|uniref:Pycsar system effector family protein n=1 Tax=Streptomyces hawaiiensis TaxID=67305 RepID=UPI0036618367
MLAFDGAVLAGLASLADKDLPLFTKATGGLAVLALAVAAVLLLLAVRPNLGGSRVVREGLPCWAQMGESELQELMGEDTRPARVKALSLLAVGKFQRLALAVDVILAALGLLTLAATGVLV